jgi:hypothetical protein
MPPSLFAGSTNRFLEIEIDGEVLTPRQQLGAVGYAAQADTSGDVACTGCVTGGEIAAGTVSTVQLAADSVQAGEIAPNAVGASEIATNAVGAAEISSSAVGASEIASNAVGNSELDNAASFDMAQLDISGDLTVQGNVSFVGQVSEIGCADGTVEQTFPGIANSSANRTMVGCAGAVSYLERDSLCAPGWYVCSYADWQNNYGAVVPSNNYWVQEDLKYNGSASACAVHRTSGADCGSSSAMKVCAPYGGCTWDYCGYGTSATSVQYYYGGCAPSTAGALCCKGEPPAVVDYFGDTSGDNIADTWLTSNWQNVVPTSSWFLFVEVQIDGGDPVRYCLADAKYYVDSYLAHTPGSFSESDGGRLKYYSSSPASGWVENSGPRTNYWGAGCAGDSYDWCISWQLGGHTLAINPSETGYGELVYATAPGSSLRFRIAATRESACGF